MAAFDFANKKGFKTFMARLYGWGASLVILGALFKINHFEGATMMLILGMGTEAIIFFFSAFERPHVEVDWSIVYPELAYQYGGEATGTSKKEDRLPQQQTPIMELNQLFKSAGVDVNLVRDFGEGLKKFSNTAQQMVDVSAATMANEGFVGNIKKASASLESLNAVYEIQLKAVTDMKLMDNQKLQVVMDELSNKLQSSVADLSGQVQSSAEQVGNYQKQMQTLTSSITSLNNIYGNMLSAMTNIKA